MDSEFNGGKIGALLYPMVNNDLKTGKVQRIKGTPILVKTINLCEDWRVIEADMLSNITGFSTDELKQQYEIMRKN